MSEQLAIGGLMQLPPHLTDGFEAFRRAYPRRHNESWSNARAAWAKALRRATISEIMDGLARYEFSPDPKFRPMASTWLNQSRWECQNEDMSADSFGLGEFVESLSAAPGLSIASYDRSAIEPILIATGWEPTWRGDLTVLNQWLKDGYLPDSIALAIGVVVAKPGGARMTLKAFDGWVRHHAERFQYQTAAD